MKPPSRSMDSPNWELLGDVGFGLGLSEHVEKTHGKTHFDDLQISIYTYIYFPTKNLKQPVWGMISIF